MVVIDHIVLTVVWLIIFIGIIGAYAMSLARMIVLTRRKEDMIAGKFLYPGAIHIIGYSFAGFLWGLELRRLLSKEGPILSMQMNWRDHPTKCAITTIEFLGIWLLVGYFIL